MDTRMIRNRQLRTTFELKGLHALAPDTTWPGIDGHLFMHECLMTVAFNIQDDRWWDVFCLNDEFPFQKSRLEGESESSEVESKETQASSSSNDNEADTSGLEDVNLDQCDPIIDEGSAYTVQNPRVYSINVLAAHLERIARTEEALFEAFRQIYQAHVSKLLRNGIHEQI